MLRLNARALRRLPVVATSRSLPNTRAECVGAARPCPYLTCRHHLAVAEIRGGVQIRDHEQLGETCALDVADRQEHPSLTAVGSMLGLSDERVRQIEQSGLEKIRLALGIVP